jgi:nucleotide-binding universal stress UspA family protein
VGAIVLGYDASPGARCALKTALALASQHGDQLVIANGVEPPGGVGDEWQQSKVALEEQARAQAQDALDEAAAAGVDATLELVPDRPASALVRVADEHDARYIVLGTWGESPIRGAILGSTPHKLLHLSTRPVVVVPER